MFTPSQNILRYTVVQSLIHRFNLSEAAARAVLDKRYPRAFFPLLAVTEYQQLVEWLRRGLTNEL